jgi:hypothetical protein
MSDAVATAIEFLGPPPPAPTPTGAELRAELAALIQEDLLLRFQRAAPKDRVAIEITAGLAADTAHLTKLFGPDCDPRVAPLLLAGIKRLMQWLWTLGTDRIADTVAERILYDAIAIEGDVLASIPPAGTA